MTPAQRIAAALPGETLLFADGEPLGAVSIRGKRGLTIRGGMARSVTILGSDAVTLEGMTRDPAGPADWARAVVDNGVGCGVIRVVGCDLDGGLDPLRRPAGRAILADPRTALIEAHDNRARNFDRFLVAGGEFFVAWTNRVSRTRGSAIHGALTSGGGDVRRNLIDTIMPTNYGGLGDHANAIVLRAGRPVTRHCAMVENVFLQGDGYPVMGMSAYGLRTGLGVFEALEVRGNLVATACGQAMRLEAMAGGLVADNDIRVFSDPRARTSSGPMILLVDGCRDVTLRGERMAFDRDMPAEARNSMRWLERAA